MRRLLRFLTPLLILAGGIAVASLLIRTAPQSERKPPVATPPGVEVLTLHPQDYQVEIESRGTAEPGVKITLIPEVSGTIQQVAANFRNGGFFRAGETLLQIDPRDYENALVVARAEVAQRTQELAEEQMRATQAQKDWDKLQLEGDPDPLALRQPQLAAAKAALEAAEALQRQARIDLERTRISAPFDGRILSKSVDVGQFVGSGTPLAEIYASDSIEVRLPISNEQLEFLQLAEQATPDGTSQPGPPVLFSAEFGRKTYQWTGRIVRTEAAVDVRSRQQFVVARVDQPYQHSGDRPLLKIGQHLEARITGEILPDVFIIPRSAVRGENTAHLIDAENRLQRVALDVLWRDPQSLIVGAPLRDGDRLSLTPLPFAADGIEVGVIEPSSSIYPATNQER